MSKAPAHGRHLLVGIEASGTFPVEYRFTHAKSGNRHLVVVFANFSAPEEYGWSNGVFDNVRANILWIRDRFDGMNSYYLCKEMDFTLAESVAALILNVMRSLSLTPDDVTLWGGSKGGSAALYFGLRHGFRNIVSIVPQFLIGTYVRKTHPRVAAFMLGAGVPEENVRAVDAILPELVRSETSRTANIYLLSSPQDEQYGEQVEPFLGLFQRYENFNFILSESPFITDHTQVTRRNVPALMGILNLLVDGLPPRLGHVRNGAEEPDRDRSAIASYLAATSVVRGDEFPPPVVTAPASREEVRRDAVRFTGHAPGAVRVVFWEHGKYLGQADVAADGDWSWKPGRAWSLGRHSVRLYAVDAAGFQTARVGVDFTAVDGAAAAVPAAPAAPPASRGPVPPAAADGPPAPVVSEPLAHEQVTDPRVVFAGSAPDATEVGFRERDVPLGRASVAPDGTWSWDSGRPWSEGLHVVDVCTVDALGGESSGTRVLFSVMPASAGAATAPYRAGSRQGLSQQAPVL
ncbi:hypothetical protein ACIHCX_05970 [Streptomyces sp. NPDC052043]|uniref:hypothetical protein n=1 Tax=Streptomyces sp. NPDC052043 TaxID=3365684 RepID=UPI0037D66DC0